MGVRKSTEFETLRVLHTLWRSRDLDIVKVKTILKETYNLELTVLTNGEISAQTPDGKNKYSIK